MMKRLFCLLLAVCMAVSLCACRKDSENGAENDTLSSEGESSTPAEIIPTPDEQETTDEQQTPEEPEQTQTSADGVDVDLTVLSSTMVYSEVYNMLLFTPDSYLGKTVKMTGQFSYYEDTTTGNQYFACIIADATACCAQGLEFVWAGEHIYPDDYPEYGTDIIVIGRLESYMENDLMYLHLVDAEVIWSVSEEQTSPIQ